MKKNLVLMLTLSAFVVLAGCDNQNVENTDVENTETGVAVVNETNEDVEAENPEWVAKALTLEDLERIEETLPPLSYNYETYDMQAGEISDSGTYTAPEGEDNKLYIPEYDHMVSREVTSSGIEDDMIYTLTNITLDDGNVLQVLYVNEPDTLFCRAISVQNGEKTTLYSNFVYLADVA